MQKYILILLAVCLVMAGCSSSPAAVPTVEQQTEAKTTETGITVYPLPETLMDTIDNATFAVSLGEGDAYVDDTGIMRMDVKVYSYDLYDMVDIASLKAGDTLMTHSGAVAVTSVERTESGIVRINGGLDSGGMDLTGEYGGYYESGYSDAKSWYQIGEATLRVHADMEFRDTSDLEKGEQTFYAGSFLVGEVTDYHFTPHNTRMRTENGQIVAMERFYTP